MIYERSYWICQIRKVEGNLIILLRIVHQIYLPILHPVVLRGDDLAVRPPDLQDRRLIIVRVIDGYVYPLTLNLCNIYLQHRF